MQYEACIASPVGALTLVANDSALIAIRFAVSARADESPILTRASRELEEYFLGQRNEFTVPISLNGTAFQLTVWEELRKIHYGETITYGELACRLGKQNASRAVGGANHLNPIPIIVPCHRVIGANGKLTGYAGGLNIKRQLLAIEGKHVEI